MFSFGLEDDFYISTFTHGTSLRWSLGKLDDIHMRKLQIGDIRSRISECGNTVNRVDPPQYSAPQFLRICDVRYDDLIFAREIFIQKSDQIVARDLTLNSILTALSSLATFTVTSPQGKGTSPKITGLPG
jgi:hypothetical protein